MHVASDFAGAGATSVGGGSVGGAGMRRRQSTACDDEGVESGVARQVRFSADVRGRPVWSVDTHTSPSSSVDAPPISPVSPVSRSRGYSLRSALFRKHVHDTAAQTADATIELQDWESAEGARYGMGDTDEWRVSKGRGPVFMVTPEYEDYAQPPLQHGRWFGGGQGDRTRYSKRVKELAEQVHRFVFRIQDVPPSKNGRHIPLDAHRGQPLTDERTEQPYTSNWIRSTRYSAWNFVPRQLVAQFSKLANFYFLTISILQMIPGLSTTGQFTTIVPLLFFVTLSIAKEGYDDLRRYRLDKTENNREALVLRADPGVAWKRGSMDCASTPSPSPSRTALRWETIKWQHLNVGDIIRLDRDDTAPADLALLHTAGENSVAYVETMALDGETNLKSKQTPALITKTIISAQDILCTQAEFVVEDPNRDLYDFQGRVTVDGKQAPLTLNEIIFRGSILRNTPNAIGIVVYSGEECRIRMNANKNPRIKAPTLQFLVNRIVVIIVVFVVLLAVFNAVAYKVWQRQEPSMWYLANTSVAFLPSFISFIIMFNTMIPLSLYVSLEIVKLAQMFFLHADIDMYDEESNTPCEPRTSTINEELGQVSYIFSDKTGTLTDNSMKFRKLSVGGMAWLHDADLRRETKGVLETKTKGKGKGKGKSKSKSKRKGKASVMKKEEKEKIILAEETTTPSGANQDAVPQWKSSARPGKTSRELRTQDMLRYIQQKPHTSFSKKARMFLLSLALCHTCLPEMQDDGETHFMASSPDELALVQAAQDMGFLLINRDVHSITLKMVPASAGTEPLVETYKILDVIEFSSKRKRMSIVLRFPDSRICIICKGADSIVMQRLKLATLANKKMVEIERRTTQRKSMDAQRIIARMSEQTERRGSVMGRKSMSLGQAARASLSLGRPSFARSSIGGRASLSVREEMDQWLRERENDGLDSQSMEDSLGPTPRPSGLGRFSMAFSSSARSSMQLEEVDSLVDEHVAGDDSATMERCLQHINDFATEGLRTLLYGYKFMAEADYAVWKKGYLNATTSLVDRTRLIEEAGDRIETDLDLCAATAIEDKLQKGVPEAIDKLRRANIKLWMLTGDKRETAINIGYSCRLVKEYSTVTILDHERGDLAHTMASALAALHTNTIPHSVIVIDGPTLTQITTDASLTHTFHTLAITASTVICCRASPSQKAHLVHTIRKRLHTTTTLAIGDGANDIAMIQEAHVGIGITGKEGLQAARTSDYSIAQFRFLPKLLLVHGRWNYLRTCKYTVGTFWKELLFYTTQALWQHQVGFTGTSLYESWGLSMFNTLFTSLPVIFMGVFEQDLQPHTLLAVPELYAIGQRGGGFNVLLYMGWMLMAGIEALVVFWGMWGLYARTGWVVDDNVYAVGSISYTVVVCLIAVKMQIIETHIYTFTNAIALVVSIGGWFLWTLILSFTYKHDAKIYNVRSTFVRHFGNTLHWWSVVILLLATVVLIELAVQALRVTFWAQAEDVWRVVESEGGVRGGHDDDNGIDGHARAGLEQERKQQQQVDEAREREVGDLLRKRQDSGGTGCAHGVNGGAVDSMLSRGFGEVKM